MSIKENKVIVQRIFEEVINGRSLDVVEELFAPDYIFHGPGGQELHGP